MPIIRAQVVLQGQSGLPEDQFVTVTHWDTDGSPIVAQDYTDIAANLTEFWTVPAGGPGIGLDEYLSGAVTGAATIKMYDLQQPPPRIPVEAALPLNVNPTAQDAMPEEVALCLSFHGLPPITPRRRGRIYIGPFNARVLNDATPTSSRPSLSLRQSLAAAAARMAASTAGPSWSIRSLTPTPNSVFVVGGWVDNAWDTQRRRGLDPDSRLTW